MKRETETQIVHWPKNRAKHYVVALAAVNMGLCPWHLTSKIEDCWCELSMKIKALKAGRLPAKRKGKR